VLDMTDADFLRSCGIAPMDETVLFVNGKPVAVQDVKLVFEPGRPEGIFGPFVRDIKGAIYRGDGR
jgi:hypothetical protein